MKGVSVKFLLLLLCFHLLAFPISCNDQIKKLREVIKAHKYGDSLRTKLSNRVARTHRKFSPVYVGSQDGQMEADKIDSLPGQPQVDFDQYAGYITVDPNDGRALFYYLAESPQDSSTKPLVLWLNGGPGCSSLGYGAMEELGPFRVNSDGKTLYRNEYAWNNVANVLFLESPAGVGFSYSNTSSDYITGDTKTAQDSYTFLVNWLERFPQYKTRDFYITGESYAGHYIPQLASLILAYNKNTTQTTINLKGIAIGNAYIDVDTTLKGGYDFYWTHALNSDETNEGINKYCDFVHGNYSSLCIQYLDKGEEESGDIDDYNIYAPLCHDEQTKSGSPSSGSVKDFDPCTDDYVYNYLNLPEVQAAFHAKPTEWDFCDGKLRGWTDRPRTVLPTVQRLTTSGISFWLYSGDTDSVVSITATRDAIKTFSLPIETAWRPWNSSNEVGGYVVQYKGLTLVTVRGAGHTVPSYQPERSLTMISSFLQGQLPPAPPA